MLGRIFPWTYFYLEVNESPWLLRGPVFPFPPSLMIFTVVLTERLSLLCQRVPDTGPQAVRLRVGVFGWAPVPLFILWVIGLCLWFPSRNEESACLRDVSGLTVWQRLGLRGALWAVLEAGRNPCLGCAAALEAGRNLWSFLFLYFFLAALHNFFCHVLFHWLANLPCRWSSLK